MFTWVHTISCMGFMFFYFANLHWTTQPPAWVLCFYSVPIFLSLLPLLVCCLLTLWSCLIIVLWTLKPSNKKEVNIDQIEIFMSLSFAHFFKDFQYKAFRDFLCFQTNMQKFATHTIKDHRYCLGKPSKEKNGNILVGGYPSPPSIGKRPIYFRFFLLKASLMDFANSVFTGA